MKRRLLPFSRCLPPPPAMHKTVAKMDDDDPLACNAGRRIDFAARAEGRRVPLNNYEKVVAYTEQGLLLGPSLRGKGTTCKEQERAANRRRSVVRTADGRAACVCT